MNTKRKHDVKIRLSDTEYETFCKSVEDTGLTKQMYGLEALLSAKVTSKEELDLLEDINKKMANLARIELGIGTNINQIARRVNSNHEANTNDIQMLQMEYKSERKEREKIWLSIRLLLQQLKHMQQ